MFESRATRNLFFVSRQLASVAKKASLEQAFETVEDATPTRYAGDIERCRELLLGDGGAAQPLGLHPLTSLSGLIRAFPEKREPIFAGFVDYIDQSRAVFQSFWVGIVGLFVYLVFLTAVALIVTAVYSAYVYPTFQSNALGWGARLPPFTLAVLGTFNIGPFAALLVFFIILAGAAVGAITVYRRIQQLRALPSVPHWVPVAGPLVDCFNLDLFMNFTRILREADVSPSECVSVAAALTGLDVAAQLDGLALVRTGRTSDVSLNELGIAERLGGFDRELSIQCDQHVAELISTLSRIRDRVALFLKVVLFSIVSLLVTAMYLPIFKMGSVL